MPFSIEVLAKSGAHGTLLDDGQRRGQCAGTQQDREIVRALHGEAAGNLAGTAEDRLADHRGGDHLVVEHDGERSADVLLRHLGKTPRAVVVETESDDRLAIALIEARLRVGEILARHQHPLLDQVRRLSFGLRAGQNFGFRRHPAALLRLVGRHRLVDHAERQLGGLAEQFLEPRGILQARHLNQHAVDALALDRRLDGAKLVDAALDDLDRLLDRLADALDQRRLGGRKPDQAAAGIDDVDGALSGGAEQPSERL